MDIHISEEVAEILVEFQKLYPEESRDVEDMVNTILLNLVREWKEGQE